MKKLMIAIAIVCATAMSQAANCNWNSTAYAANWQTTLEGGTYWLVNIGMSDAGLADLVINDDGTANFGAYASSVVETDTIGTAGAVGGTLTELTTADNGTYYALVVWDGVTGSEGMYGKAAGVVANIATDPTPQDADTISFDNSTYGGYVLANTATQAAPEPTSGLLLLLGVAGLALRRRRA